MDASDLTNGSSPGDQRLREPVTPSTGAIVDPDRNKRCNCKTSKFFPHRRSKCALRARNADATAAMAAGIAGTAVAAGSLTYLSSALKEEKRSSKVTTTTTTSTENLVQNTRSSAVSSSTIAAERSNGSNEAQELVTRPPLARSSSDVDDVTDEDSASARTLVLSSADRSPSLESVSVSRKETTTSVVSQASSSMSSTATSLGASQKGTNSTAGRSDEAFDIVWRPAPANAAAASIKTVTAPVRSKFPVSQRRPQVADGSSVPQLELVDQEWGGKLAPALHFKARAASGSSSVPSRVNVSQLPQSRSQPVHHQPSLKPRNQSRQVQEPPVFVPPNDGSHDWYNFGMGDQFTGMFQDFGNPYYESKSAFTDTHFRASNSESVATMEASWSSLFMPSADPTIPFSSNDSVATFDALYTCDKPSNGGNSFHNGNMSHDPITAVDVVEVEPESFEALNALKEYIINQIGYTVDLAKSAEKILVNCIGSEVYKIPAVLNLQKRLLNRIERFEDFRVDEDSPLPPSEIQAQLDKFRSASYEDFVVVSKFVDIMHRQLTSGTISYNKEGFVQLQEIHNLAMSISE